MLATLEKAEFWLEYPPTPDQKAQAWDRFIEMLDSIFEQA